MKALTLIQPWAWAVCHAGKRVENRTWRPPPSVLGQRIAIHAGKKYDADDAEWIAEEHGIEVPQTVPLGAIVAMARVLRAFEAGPDGPPITERARDPRGWAFGPWCWVLADVVVLPQPVPCRGAQGLWDVPADVERAIEQQMKAWAEREMDAATALAAREIDASRPGK